jgi:ABC-type sulfate transport system permease subunit
MSNQSKPKYDLLILGSTAGIFSVIIKDLLELILTFFIPSFDSSLHLAAGIVLTPEQVKSDILTLIVGLEINFAVSIVIGIIAALALFRWGFDYWQIKGITLGLLAWVIINVTLAKFMSSIPRPTSILIIELSLLTDLIYGLTVAWFLQRFTKRRKEKSM